MSPATNDGFLHSWCNQEVVLSLCLWVLKVDKMSVFTCGGGQNVRCQKQGDRFCQLVLVGVQRGTGFSATSQDVVEKNNVEKSPNYFCAALGFPLWHGSPLTSCDVNEKNNFCSPYFPTASFETLGENNLEISPNCFVPVPRSHHVM